MRDNISDVKLTMDVSNTEKKTRENLYIKKELAVLSVIQRLSLNKVFWPIRNIV